MKFVETSPLSDPDTAARKLMEIAVGGQPLPCPNNFCSTTDIAFAKNGHLFISDGYRNARILEYSADGKKLNEWGKPGTGPGEAATGFGPLLKLAVDALDELIHILATPVIASEAGAYAIFLPASRIGKIEVAAVAMP